LNRGEKLTELLKQKQYVPMKAEEQVCLLYAGVRGFLDKLETSEIDRFEKLFLEELKAKHSNVLDSIAAHKELKQEVDDELNQILIDFIPSSGLKLKV